MHFFENSACFSYLSVVGWLYKMRKDTNTMNTMLNEDIKKHANLINKVDSKLAEINSLTKAVYPNKNLDDVLEKVLDKIESNNNQ